jgi:hypothetical protein
MLLAARSTESVAYARHAKTKYLETRTMNEPKQELQPGEWISSAEASPSVGEHIRVYHPEWRDEFTPTGTREATYDDDEGFLTSRWMPDQDQWEVFYCYPTHWCYPDMPDGEQPYPV